MWMSGESHFIRMTNTVGHLLSSEVFYKWLLNETISVGILKVFNTGYERFSRNRSYIHFVSISVLPLL